VFGRRYVPISVAVHRGVLPWARDDNAGRIIRIIFLIGLGRQDSVECQTSRTFFWKEWLPTAARDVASRQAAQIEAGAFRSLFGDRSLEDAAREAEDRRSQPVWPDLAVAITRNQEGDVDTARSAAERVLAQGVPASVAKYS
jgi:hypothetical protein